MPEEAFNITIDGELMAEGPPEGARKLAQAPPLRRDDDPENQIYMIVADAMPFEHPIYIEGLGFFDQVELNMDSPRAIDVSWVKAGHAPHLASHDYGRALGRIQAVWLHDKKFWAESAISRRPSAQDYLVDIKDGIVSGVSIGARVLEAKVIQWPDRDGQGGIVRAQRWEFKEASSTPMPRNPRVGIQAADRDGIAALIRAQFDWGTTGQPSEEAGQDMTNQATEIHDPQPAQAGDPGATPVVQATQATPTTPTPGSEPGPTDPTPTEITAGAEETRVLELVDLGKRFGNKAAAMDAIEAGMSPLDFAKSLGKPEGDEEHKAYQQPKPSPVNAEFSLDHVIEAALFPDSPPVRERTANSLRAIEVIRAARQDSNEYNYPTQKGGVMVPEQLLVAQYNREAQEHRRNMVRAALTTSTTGSGLIDEQLLAQDFVDILIDMTHTVPYCNVMRGLDSTFAIPYTSDAPDTAAYAEGAGPADPSTFSVATRPSTPKRLVCYYEYTPEAQVASQMRIGNYGLMEAARVLAEFCETQFWKGTGIGGQVSGLETLIVAGRQSTYTAAQPTKQELRAAKTKMNKEKMPMMGRLWVASPDMKAELDFLAQVDSVNALVMNEMMFDHSIIESTYPTVRAGDAFGVLWLLHAMSIQVAFYGADVEVIFDRQQKTGAYEATMLKLWDMFPRRPQFGQQVRSA